MHLLLIPRVCGIRYQILEHLTNLRLMQAVLSSFNRWSRDLKLGVA